MSADQWLRLLQVLCWRGQPAHGGCRDPQAWPARRGHGLGQASAPPGDVSIHQDVRRQACRQTACLSLPGSCDAPSRAVQLEAAASPGLARCVGSGLLSLQTQALAAWSHRLCCRTVPLPYNVATPAALTAVSRLPVPSADPTPAPSHAASLLQQQAGAQHAKGEPALQSQRLSLWHPRHAGPAQLQRLASAAAS